MTFIADDMCDTFGASVEKKQTPKVCPKCGAELSSLEHVTVTQYDCGSFYNRNGRFIQSRTCVISQRSCDIPDVESFLRNYHAIDDNGMVNFHWTYIKILFDNYIDLIIKKD